MTTHKKEHWRNCDNCVHNYVCRFRTDNKDPESCVNHIYDADPKRYGDLEELVSPVTEWIRNHYPSEGKLIVDKCSATFEIPIHCIYIPR